MYGLMVSSEDGKLTVTILPKPSDTRVVLLVINVDGLVLPPIPLPVAELEQVLETRSGF